MPQDLFLCYHVSDLGIVLREDYIHFFTFCQGVAIHIALSGPSGIGKGYIHEHILRVYPSMQELRWLTTRPPRTTVSDANRQHVSVDAFAQLVASGDLVLVQNIFGHNYGLSRRDLAPRAGLYLTEIHPKNLQEALEINPRLVAIGLMTSEPALLRHRLEEVRRTEHPEEIEVRLAEGTRDMQAMRDRRVYYTALIDVTSVSQRHVVTDVLATIHSCLERGVSS